MALPGPGRYTMQVTVTLFADSPRDAYQQIDRALGADWRRHRIDFVDAEETRVEPFCCNYDTHDMEGEADLAVEGTTLCAACSIPTTEDR